MLRTRPDRRNPLLVLVPIIAATVFPGRASGQVLVNEFLYRDPDARLEFVEVLNHSNARIDLRRLAVSDSRMAFATVTARPLFLDPDRLVVLVRDSVAFDARFDAPRIEVPGSPALNNGGDAVILWLNGATVDSVRFDGSWGTPGRSMERVDPDAPSSSPVNWKPSEDPSGATPGTRNSVFNPDKTPPEIVEVEEWLDGSVIVYVNEPLDPARLPAARFSFASGDQPLASRLSQDRMKIVLEPWSGADLSFITVEGLVDASGNRTGSTSHSIARQPASSEVILNEILFEPLADAFDGFPDQSEFVEIRSLSNHPIAMRGFFLTGRLDETGASDTLRFDDRPLRLHAKGFALFLAAGSSEAGAFAAAFPSLPPETVAPRAAVRRSTLSLGNNGDTVRLHSAAGVVLDELTYAPSWHLPERSVTRGVSLERIAGSGRSDDASNWTSSVSPEGATPGRGNSVSLSTPAGAGDGLTVSPTVFSPDGDGWEDYTRIVVRTGRPTASIVAWIYDEEGRFIRSLTDGLPIGPEASLIWDGRDDDGRMLATGVFIVYVEAVDTSAGDVRQFKRPVVLAQSY